MFRHVFPLEIERHIFSYDSTYHEYFQKEVLPEVIELAWKKLTFQFFTATIDFTLYAEFMYDMLSDFEEESEEEDNEDL